MGSNGFYDLPALGSVTIGLADSLGDFEIVSPNPTIKFVSNIPNQFEKATGSAAGFDIVAAESGAIAPNCKLLISTDLFMAIPEGYCGIIKSRSGLAVKHGIEHGAGVIDSDYRGEVKVLLYNFGDEIFTFDKGERIAQMIILPVPAMNTERVLTEELSDTARGSGGFGSTGR